MTQWFHRFLDDEVLFRKLQRVSPFVFVCWRNFAWLKNRTVKIKTERRRFTQFGASPKPIFKFKKLCLEFAAKLSKSKITRVDWNKNQEGHPSQTDSPKKCQKMAVKNGTKRNGSVLYHKSTKNGTSCAFELKMKWRRNRSKLQHGEGCKAIQNLGMKIATKPALKRYENYLKWLWNLVSNIESE